MKKIVIASSLVWACFSSDAFAGDFSFQYPHAPNRIIGQSDDLILHIGESVDDETLSEMFLELDGIDITGNVSLNGNVITFYPVDPYAPGKHVLRIVKLGKNAKLEEIKRWQFQVAGSDGQVPENTITIEGALNATYTARVWDNINDAKDEPDIQNVQSQADVSVSGQSGRWAGQFTGNGFANSDKSLNPGQDPFEVGEYLIDTSNAQDDFTVRTRLGNHDIGASNLLMDKFHRRGFSSFIDENNNSFRLGGFFMNPAASVGNTNITGNNDADQRVSGGYGTWQPFKMLGEKLEFEATAYTGKGGQDGSGSSSILSQVNDGHGFQGGVKSTLIPDHLKMHAQFAHTNFDEDGSTGALSDKGANAYAWSFFLTPLSGGQGEGDIYRSLDMEFNYLRAGADFQTLLNSGAEQDREMYETRASYVYDNWTADGDLAWLRDNVDGDTLLPIDSSLQGNLQASYTPKQELFGAPVINFGGNFSNDQRWDTPAGYSGEDLDRLTTSLNGGVTLSFDKTTWSLNQTYTTLNDDAQTLNDYTSHYTDFTVEYRANDRLTLRPGIQTEILNENNEAGESQNWHLSLGIDGTIIPDKIWNTTQVSAQIDNNTDNADGRHYAAETEFTWQLKESVINSPGFALSLSGHYDNDTDTDVADDNEFEEGRVFLRLKIAAPFARY